MLAIPSFVGHVVSGYRIEQLLAQGQASVAFRMRHITSRQAATFTIALLPETLSQQAFTMFMTRFVRLAAKLSTLTHEHLLPILDYGEYGGYPYLITASAEGTSVATVLKHHGRYSPESTLNVLRQVASALDYAHQQGIVHGNLRPAVLLLQEDQQLRISGLGMVQLLEARGVIEDPQPYAHLCNLMGTYLSNPIYLAPEYIQGGPTDARCDLYALGLLFFELLSGETPFSGQAYLDIALQHVQGSSLSFAQRCPELKFPQQFDLLLSRALAYAPEQRFERAVDFVAAYERILMQQREIALVASGNEMAMVESQSSSLPITTRSAPVPVRAMSTVLLSSRFQGISASPSDAERAGQYTQRAPSQQKNPPQIEKMTQTEPLGKITQVEQKDYLVPQSHMKDGAALKTPLSAYPTQRERDKDLLRHIEEYVWNENELPVLSQTEPLLITPLGPLYPASPQHSLSWRNLLCLAVVVVAIILICMVLGAWGMEQFQHNFVQPVIPQKHVMRSMVTPGSLVIMLQDAVVRKEGRGSGVA